MVVNSPGLYTEEIGFTIDAPNGTTIFKKSTGSQFINNTVLITLCPVSCPPPNPTLNLKISMETVGSGWSGSVGGVRQKGVVLGTFGTTFTTSTVPAPVNIVVQGNAYV